METKGKTQGERVVTIGVMAMRGFRILAAWVFCVVLAGGGGGWGQAGATGETPISATQVAMRERMLMLYYQAKQTAKDQLEYQRFNDAESNARAALDLIDRHSEGLSDIERKALRDSAVALLDQVKRERANNEVAAKAGFDLAAANRRETGIAQMKSDARKLYDATQYKEAAELLRQATTIDPQDEEAARLLRVVMTKIMARDGERVTPQSAAQLVGEAQKKYDAQQYAAAVDLLRQAMILDSKNVDALTLAREIEKKIMSREEGLKSATQGARWTPMPFEPSYGYAPVRATSEKPTPDTEPVPTARDRAVYDRLEENLKEIASEAQGLEKVMNFVRDTMGVNVIVNWAALSAAGVDRNSPVTVSMKEVPFRKALKTILTQADKGKGSLVFCVQDGTLVVTTRADLMSERFQVVKTYDVRDLLAGFPVPIAATGTQPAFQDPAERRKRAMANLIETIKITVAPESWQQAGGTGGTIQEADGRLTIKQTADNQLAIYNLLTQLRASHSAHVVVQSRLFLVTRDVLDGLSVEWKPWAKQAATSPALIAQTGVRSAILDGMMLVQFLNAANRKEAIVLNAPRCILFEDLSGSISCTVEQGYVSGFTREESLDGATRMKPAFSFVETGVYLGLQCHFSADLRQVDLGMRLATKAVRGMNRAAAPDTPPEQKLQIENPTLDGGSGEMTTRIADPAAVLVDVGPVAADFLRLPTTAGAAGPTPKDMRLLILVHATIRKGKWE
jgi:tetratricopeptide (TPR) repeat protein